MEVEEAYSTGYSTIVYLGAISNNTVVLPYCTLLTPSHATRLACRDMSGHATRCHVVVDCLQRRLMWHLFATFRASWLVRRYVRDVAHML